MANNASAFQDKVSDDLSLVSSGPILDNWELSSNFETTIHVPYSGQAENEHSSPGEDNKNGEDDRGDDREDDREDDDREDDRYEDGQQHPLITKFNIIQLPIQKGLNDLNRPMLALSLNVPVYIAYCNLKIPFNS